MGDDEDVDFDPAEHPKCPDCGRQLRWHEAGEDSWGNVLGYWNCKKGHRDPRYYGRAVMLNDDLAIEVLRLRRLLLKYLHVHADLVERGECVCCLADASTLPREALLGEDSDIEEAVEHEPTCELAHELGRKIKTAEPRG